MAPLTTLNDISTLKTNESMVIDGANSVSGAPRAGFPQAALWEGLALVALLVFGLAPKRHRGLVAGVLALSMVPGWWVLLTVRPDRPTRRHEVAQAVTTAMNELRPALGSLEGPPNVVWDDGDVLFPLARYLAPTRSKVGPAVELKGHTLRIHCTGAPVSRCEGGE